MKTSEYAEFDGHFGNHHQSYSWMTHIYTYIPKLVQLLFVSCNLCSTVLSIKSKLPKITSTLFDVL